MSARDSAEPSQTTRRSQSPTLHPDDPSLEQATGEKTTTDSEPPDGGLAAWTVVLGVWCTSFCSFGWLNSIGTFQEYYQNDLLSDYSPSTIAWIPSLQLFFMMSMGPIVGQLYDRFGPRWLVFGGSLLHVFGIMMTSLATKYYQILLAQGVCSAIGVSAIFQPSLNCIHGWFTTKRGAAFGILSTGSSVGGVVFPIMVPNLIREVGYGWAMRISGFLLLVLLVIANLTVRARSPPSPQRLSKAQITQPFKEVPYVLLLLGFFCFTYGIFVPINYLPSQAVSVGMAPNLAQYLPAILNAASLFGRIASGILGDKIGRYNIFIVVCYLSGLWILALWIPDSSNAGIIVFAALFGFTSGAYVSLIAPLVAQVSPMAEIGWRTGLLFAISSIGALTTSPISGAILETPSGWWGVKVFAGIFCLAGTTFVLVARVQKMGWNPAMVF
ncbi:monocarboxylate transporter 2 [Emericellopsis cladophorae]|uniref:Monocarboxylate transporter 2 n=1 Tax=Emericellopsis cladophorae TaxID=2686198 RepID=A0A9P9XW22_9HYPO|nr:monocarboxylate transporter 2 [Emericellopsis cladophorae]KAI6778424.1 monocarboxylate transporter 2 [Emericellopsis cladophorae]